MEQGQDWNFDGKTEINFGHSGRNDKNLLTIMPHQKNTCKTVLEKPALGETLIIFVKPS